MKYLFYALRPKQWVKNGFIFLPLIFGQKLFSFPENLLVCLAFVAFSLAASSAYLVNDVLDYERDKEHPTKRLRPIASGKVSRRTALVTACILCPLSLAFSFSLNQIFGAIVVFYLGFNWFYSRYLKRFVIVDVFCLAAFFILRILAGSYVGDIPHSYWMLFMAGLLALFLGFNKRRQELRMLGADSEGHRQVLAKYNLYFIDQMVSVVTASTVIAYALYTIDPRTVGLVGSKHLAFTIPFVYYGIFRYLYLLHKRQNEGDPTRVLLTDYPMQLNLLFWVLTAVAVIYFKI